MPTQDVVVVGYLQSYWGPSPGSGGSGRPNTGELHDTDTYDDSGGVPPGGEGGPWYPPEVRDEDEVRVDLNINRELTPAEKIAFDKFVSTVRANIAALEGLNPNLVMTTVGGKQVTVADLQRVWSKVDFKIDDVGEGYANQSYRGQADYDNGAYTVSFNIAHLQDVSNSTAAAMAFQSLHDVAHLSAIGLDFHFKNVSDPNYGVKEEMIANDIAHGLQDLFGTGTYNETRYGYSPEITGFHL